jgi:hypothetical protein
MYNQSYNPQALQRRLRRNRTAYQNQNQQNDSSDPSYSIDPTTGKPRKKRRYNASSYSQVNPYYQRPYA